MVSVLITGSSKGMGENLALVFAEKGFDIILHGRNEENLENIKRKILEKNVSCYIVVGDIRDNETIKRLSEEAE